MTMTTSTRLLAYLIASTMLMGLVTLGGCKTSEKTTGGKAGAQGSAPAGFLKGFIPPAQIVRPTQVVNVAKADMAKRINALGTVVYHHPPSGGSETTGCIAEAIAGVKAVAGKDRLSFDIPGADLTACMNREVAAQNTAGSSVTIDTAQLRVQLRGFCEGGDATIFNGKGGREFLGTDVMNQFCQIGDRVSQLLNIEFSQRATIRTGGLTITYGTRTLSGVMDANGDACVATRAGTDWNFSSCKRFEIITVDDIQTNPPNQPVPAGLQSKGEYYIADFANLIGVNKGRYYKSGVVSLDFNSWQGQIRYNGAENPPSWSMSGAGGTVNGTFVPYTTAGLRLHRLMNTTSAELREFTPRFLGVWF